MTEVITTDCYDKVCDAIYVRGEPLPKGNVIFVCLEDIDEIFLQLSFFPDRPVILVSANSDYTLHYQKENHPNHDIKKIIYTMNWQGIERATNYIPLQIVTWNQQRCNPHHAYSVKIDRFTICTFHKIPNNVVKWFCANANVNERQIEFLPFGVNYEGHGKDIVLNYYKKLDDKPKSTYFNLGLNSTRRIQLHEHFFYRKDKESDWLTYLEKTNRSIEEFYSDLAEHKFIVNCEANGIDGFRNWEALACGSIPLVENSRWARNAVDAGFNFMVVNDLTELDSSKIQLLESVIKKSDNLEMVKREYWYNKINESRNLLKKD